MTAPRSTLGLIGALLGLFLGGGAIGGALAAVYAPNSWIADVVSFFALPLAFAIGMQLWYGFALLTLIPRLLGWGRAARPVAAEGGKRVAVAIPGSFVFLPLSSAAGWGAGVVVGLLSPTHPAWLVMLVYWAVGTAHGALSWRLARGGYLVPPETV